MYTRESIVTVHPFTRQTDGKEVVIGLIETGVFLALPQEAVTLLDQLARGKCVGEVTDSYQQLTGEMPDMQEFLSVLEAKAFVSPFQGESGSGNQAVNSARKPKYHFSGFPQPLAKLLFSRPVLILAGLLVALAIAAIILNHSLMPVPADLVFQDHRALNLSMLTVATYAAIFLHEMCHLIAARAVGVNSRMGISHRLWYLVAETDMTGLWSVERSKRFLPMLAGMIFDTTFTAAIIMLLLAEQRQMLLLSAFTIHLLRAIAFSNVARLLWECFFFTRTDLYFVAATFLNCKNLLNDTRVLLWNQLARVTSRVKAVNQSAIPVAELQAIRIYAWLFLAGRAWAFVTLFWVTIPVVANYWGPVVSTMNKGYSASPADFLDTLAAATYFLAPTLAGFIFWGRSFTRPKELRNVNS